MSPRNRNVATTSSSSRAAPSNSGRTSTPSQYSSVPSYSAMSPPPAYSTQPMQSPPLSSYPPMSKSGYAPSPSPYTGNANILNAPFSAPIALPFVPNPLPPTMIQSYKHITPAMLKPNRNLDFGASSLPPLAHLGPATNPPIPSLPITFECLPFIFDVPASNADLGISIDDVARFVHAKVHGRLTDKELEVLRECSQRRNAMTIVDALGRHTRFNGLRLSSLGNDRCVWIVQFTS